MERAPRGRGSTENPANRFVRLAVVREPCPDDPTPSLATEFFRDRSRSVISRNDSPDLGFDASLNPYRGCEHGCAYCYARPTHEFLGFSAGLDFETRILVKQDAAERLRRALAAPSWRPRTLVLSGVTDPYQPVERRLGITRRCLEVLAEFRNPVGVVTKNALVARDADLLADLARHSAAAVHVSMTTLRADLSGALEPRASRPAARLEAIGRLRDAGVPVGVMVAPVIPGLNDHEIPRIVAAAAAAGATFAGMVLLRLPYGVKEIFASWLERHAPLSSARVLGAVRQTRGGRLNDARFGSRMRGEGRRAESIGRIFDLAGRRAGLSRAPALSSAAFRRPCGAGADAQLELFRAT
jgi:DNA repair photolyase